MCMVQKFAISKSEQHILLYVRMLVYKDSADTVIGLLDLRIPAEVMTMITAPIQGLMHVFRGSFTVCN